MFEAVSLPSPTEGACYAMVGGATGLRSQIGLVAVLHTVPSSKVPAVLRFRAAKPLALFLALGELVADKSAAIPDRTEPLGLIARGSFAALSCALLASANEKGAALPATIGVGTAVASAFAGLKVRGILSARLPSLLAALLEDALALVLVWAGLRAGSAGRSPSKRVDRHAGRFVRLLTGG